MGPPSRSSEEFILSVLLLIEESFHILAEIVLWLFRFFRLRLLILSLVLLVSTTLFLIIIILFRPIIHLFIPGIYHSQDSIHGLEQ